MTSHMDAKYRVAVVGFAHMHVGSQIAQVQQHPAAELVGIWDDDASRRDVVADGFGIPAEQRYADLESLLERARPDVAIVCSTTSQHTELVGRLAAARVHVILEKPFAVSLEQADRMIDSVDSAGVLLAVNWPLAWYPPHLTTQRLVETGAIGDVLEVHYYDGNRGPLAGAPDAADKGASWWYSPENGGGSLHDYLGYGATLATWFRSGDVPHHVSAQTHASPGLRVDEQSVVTAAYGSGLSTFQTKWGTFTDPWAIQPAPACGFVVVGSAGTIVSRDYASEVVVQTDAHPEPLAVPVDTPRSDQTGALAHVLGCLDEGSRPTGPSSVETSRKGQQIIDTAVLSARTGRVSALVGGTGGSGTRAPEAVDYLPKDPTSRSARIGVIGCGGISAQHLLAYKAAGYNVVALCDLVLERAVERQQEFFPDADVYVDHQQLLARDDIDLVDIATHVDPRPGLVRDALARGKHVLSQKPFVKDISEGLDLIAYAASCGRLLAANQNGRWAPHFSYLLNAVSSGLIGDVVSADFWVYWPHDEMVHDDPVFSRMEDLILLDFGIHWFDVIARLFADRDATEVTARTKSVNGQRIAVPTLAHALIEFDGAQASVRFRGSSHFAEQGGYRIEGTAGVITHEGDFLGGDHVSLTTPTGTRVVELQGDWYANGMHGSMGELLLALEEGRAPSNDASTSLPGLQLCFAAMQSARTVKSVDPRLVVSASE